MNALFKGMSLEQVITYLLRRKFIKIETSLHEEGIADLATFLCSEQGLEMINERNKRRAKIVPT